MPRDDEFEAFLSHVRQYRHLSDAGGLLHWDQQVTMPEGGTPARSKQRSALSAVTHDHLVDDQLAAHLEDFEGASLSEERAAIVREVRREHDRAREVPRDLVERISEATANAHPVWEEARAEGDFSLFEEDLAHILELKREYAAAIDPDRDPYAVLFEEYEPYLSMERTERILDRLAEELPPLIDAVAQSDVEVPSPFEGTYDESDQEALVREIVTTLGYDWDRGRLDTAAHPFSMGTPYDARITTRFDPEEPLPALSSTIHEFGHATYTQGLPTEHYGTPLAENRDLTVHESQSRFWENHVGRSRAFCSFVAPTVESHLGVEVAPETLYAATNEVYDDNCIRVEADELTYHAHIVLRFEIERDLIRGDLDVSEVPSVWTEKMETYLGVTPEDDAEGALQDVHWSMGNVGYFPTYTLGSVLAAQLAAAMEAEIDVDERVRDGEFEPIIDWLREAVHRHGCRYTTPELVERATGQGLSADAFLTYVSDKYDGLYDL